MCARRSRDGQFQVSEGSVKVTGDIVCTRCRQPLRVVGLDHYCAEPHILRERRQLKGPNGFGYYWLYYEDRLINGKHYDYATVFADDLPEDEREEQWAELSAEAFKGAEIHEAAQ